MFPRAALLAAALAAAPASGEERPAERRPISLGESAALSSALEKAGLEGLPSVPAPTAGARELPAEPPALAGEEAALARDLGALTDDFNAKLEEHGMPPLDQGWVGNAVYGYKCQLVHDSFREVMRRRRLEERHPAFEFVSLYQNGLVSDEVPVIGGAGNHIFFGFRVSGRLAYYYDPWAGLGLIRYQGKSRLKLARKYLIVMPWNGAPAHRVNDAGRHVPGTPSYRNPLQ